MSSVLLILQNHVIILAQKDITHDSVITFWRVFIEENAMTFRMMVLCEIEAFLGEFSVVLIEKALPVG